MNEYTSTWSLTQFSSQATFNICILACVSGFALTTIQTSMLSQTGTTIFCMIFLTWGWKLIPNRPRKHKLPKGQSILLAGFKQNWRTCKSIWKNYKTGLRWFLVATAFAEAAAAGVTTTAVIFLNGNLQLSPLQIGIFFQVSLMTVIVGTKVSYIYIYIHTHAHICVFRRHYRRSCINLLFLTNYRILCYYCVTVQTFF